MKPPGIRGGVPSSRSLPARGAWIETCRATAWPNPSASLPARGAWIETPEPRGSVRRASRSPRGERGLKLCLCVVPLVEPLSLPARGAWIETSSARLAPRLSESLPARGAWIETCREAAGNLPPRRSPRGERGLKHGDDSELTYRVRRSPRGERGLKQRSAALPHLDHHVAPRAGSVD